MAKKDNLVHLDMRKNEIRNVSLEKRDTHPENPVEAQIYYNTTDKSVYLYIGDERWISLSTIYPKPE